MSERADQLVLEYLSRANDVAYRHLSSGERLDFIVRLRKRIEEFRAEAGGATEPEQVRKVLARFGEPEALVLRERRRLDGSGDQKPTETKDMAGRASGEPPRRSVQRLTQRPGQPGNWRPSRPSPQRRLEHQLIRARQADLPPSVKKSAKENATAKNKAPQPAEPGGAIELDVLFRRQPVEVGAIGLLGFGGLLLPIPLWVGGAVTALLSRTWTARDKVLGLLVPPLVAVALVVMSEGAGALGDGLRSDAPPVVRLAGPVGAVYLAWVLLRAIGAKTVRLTRARGRQ